MAKNGKKDNSRTTWLLVAIFVLACVAVAAVGYKYHQTFPYISERHDLWGQFGDYVGGTLNPILAFLALFALLVTIHLQVRELIQTRNVLKETVAASQHQTFESTFFQMVRLHNDITRDMLVLTHKGGKYVNNIGRKAFEPYMQYFVERYSKFLNREGPTFDPQQLIDFAYDEFSRKYRKEVGHYFRNLYTIIKFVDDYAKETDSFPGSFNPKHYTNIVRAQLSSYELALLFYNGLAPIGRKRFKGYMENYEFLENMDHSLLISIEQHYPLYDESVYGEHTISVLDTEGLTDDFDDD